jgi:hypothetical protein
MLLMSHLWVRAASLARYVTKILTRVHTVKGILAPVLHECGVTFLSLHGYGSSTKVQEEADLSLRDVDRERLVLYVGDWDCAGLYMSEEDLPNRLAKYGGRIEVRRTALTEDLIRWGHLPSFRAKTTGPRYGWFSRRYGEMCWELAAMHPKRPPCHRQAEN